MQTTDTAETLTAEEIAELVADAPAPNSGGNENGEAFCPTDEGGVNWVLGKMADARARAARIRENAEMMARAEERKAEALEWKYGASLQTFLRAELAGGKNKDLKRKSVRLYNGVLGLRTKPAGVSVTDPVAALSWAQEFLPVAVTLSLDKKALADALLTTGESVDFATLNHAEEVFYIR